MLNAWNELICRMTASRNGLVGIAGFLLGLLPVAIIFGIVLFGGQALLAALF